MHTDATALCPPKTRAVPLYVFRLTMAAALINVSCSQPAAPLPPPSAPFTALTLPGTVNPGTWGFQSGVQFNGSQGMCWDLKQQDWGNEYVRVQQNACNGTQYQQFILENIDAQGFYLMRTQFSDYKYVIQSGFTQWGGMAAVKDLGGLPGGDSFARWRFDDVPQGSGRRYIVNKYDGSCVDRPSGSMNIGDPVQTKTCDHTDNQKWIPQGPH